MAAGALVFGSIMLLGIGLAICMGRAAGQHESSFRQQAFGLEAFAREYARSRGLYMEDHDELRRRIPMPVHGSPQRAMRGPLPGGADGRDRPLARPQPARPRLRRTWRSCRPRRRPPNPPYVATAADGGWLVVCEWTDEHGRTAARLDAVAQEASRLAAAAPLHR